MNQRHGVEAAGLAYQAFENCKDIKVLASVASEPRRRNLVVVALQSSPPSTVAESLQYYSIFPHGYGDVVDGARLRPLMCQGGVVETTNEDYGDSAFNYITVTVHLIKVS